MVVGAAIALASSACDTGKKGDQPAFGAPPVIIGTSFEKWRKPDGTIAGVDRSPVVVVRFSRPMSPSSSARTNFSLGSGSIPSVELLQPRVDPVERAVIFGVGAPLEKNTQYELTIHSGGGPNALAAFDGAGFVGTEVIRFTTANDDVVTAAPSDPYAARMKATPCLAYAILQACNGSACHGGGGDSRAAPAMGLNLSFPGKSRDPSRPFADPIQDTAVGKPALQVQEPSAPGGPPYPDPRAFPRGMALIAPGDSAASYLLYKILMRPVAGRGNPAAAAYVDGTVPDLADPSQATADDLSTRMFGEPMPDPSRLPEPTSGHPLGELSWKERAEIRAWIDQGAPACPCKKFDDNGVCATSSGGDAGVDGDAASDTAAEAGDASSDSTAESGDAGADGG